VTATSTLPPAHANPGKTFLRWYFLERPLEIVHLYVEYATALGEMFSLVFLIRTLFSPWKEIIDTYPKKGFDVSQILQTFFLNLTTRSIGAFIRLSAIVTGIVLQLFLLVCFVLYFIAWVTFPALSASGFPYALYLLQ